MVHVINDGRLISTLEEPKSKHNGKIIFSQKEILLSIAMDYLKDPEHLEEDDELLFFEALLKKEPDLANRFIPPTAYSSFLPFIHRVKNEMMQGVMIDPYGKSLSLAPWSMYSSMGIKLFLIFKTQMIQM